MSDQLLMDNYLLVLKSTIEVYVHGTLESSNESIRKVLKNGLDTTLKHQAKTYDKMTQYGWYTINNVNSEKISNLLLQIENGN